MLAVPQKGFVSFDLNYKKKGLILLIVMMAMIFMAIFSFLLTSVRARRREMHLCASLIKQMEATQQAERKNMNKSLAFAIASHDVRASLAGLIGLIEMSYKLVASTSELETNLKQMEDCTQDLLGNIIDSCHPNFMLLYHYNSLRHIFQHILLLVKIHMNLTKLFRSYFLVEPFS